MNKTSILLKLFAVIIAVNTIAFIEVFFLRTHFLAFLALAIICIYYVRKSHSVGSVIGFDLSSVYRRPSIKYSISMMTLYFFTAISSLAAGIGIVIDLFSIKI